MQFKFYDKKTLAPFIATRKGETKFGENIRCAPSLEALENSDAQYVIFGIPEDIGVRANHGKPGTATAWKAFLSAFLNIQKNPFNRSENCILLGEIDCTNLMEKAARISMEDPDYHQKLGKLLPELDEIVSKTVCRIISENKTPIIIGGGHNNAYGNIKGSSVALKKPINVLNIDAHTDLRNTDYRHSGNGFSYALQEDFLHKYAIFGLHENYTPAPIFKTMEDSENMAYRLFETISKFPIKKKIAQLQNSCDFLKNQFGLEIDCDALQNFSSSAMTPSGFSLNEVRDFVRLLTTYEPFYLHLCEASAKNDPLVGKALAYLVSDFMKKN